MHKIKKSFIMAIITTSLFSVLGMQSERIIKSGTYRQSQFQTLFESGYAFDSGVFVVDDSGCFKKTYEVSDFTAAQGDRRVTLKRTDIIGSLWHEQRELTLKNIQENDSVEITVRGQSKATPAPIIMSGFFTAVTLAAALLNIAK